MGQSMVRRTTLSKGFQITLPSFARKAVGLNAGDEVDIEVRDGKIILGKAETREEVVRQMFAKLDKIRAEQERQMTAEQKMFGRRAAGWTANQYRDYIDDLSEVVTERKEKYGI